jgi:hypothetical protein
MRRFDKNCELLHFSRAVADEPRGKRHHEVARFILHHRAVNRVYLYIPLTTSALLVLVEALPTHTHIYRLALSF